MHHTAPEEPLQGPHFEGVDPLSIEVFRSFRRAMHFQKNLFGRSVSRVGGHPGQVFCLWALGDEGMTQRDLAERMHLARPTVTIMLQKMERAGLIERHVDEADQRFTRITITDAGRQMRDQTRKASADLLNATIGRLSAEDQRELTRLMDLLAAHTEEAIAELGAERPTDETGSAVGGHDSEGR